MNRFGFVRVALCLGVFLFSICEASALEVPLSGDAHVTTAHAGINYGTLSNLYVGNGNTAFLQFDLSTLPTGTTSSQVSRATLTVFVNRVNTAGSVTVSPVTASWGEYSITSATAPATGSSIGSFPVTIAGQFVSVDVTAQVQSWLNTSNSNYGLALSSSTANALFDSKENDETGHSARLDVTLVSQGPQGLQGIQGVPGPVGSTGATGLPGPIGPSGPQGLQGIQGVPGPVGLTGATGLPGPIGLQGAIGPIGPQGPTGATGAAGAGVVYRNAYDAATTYAVNDAVTFNGSTYISLQSANTGNSPDTQPTFWSVFAAAGATGITGAQGIQGIQGMPGPQGATGAPGPPGLQGLTGATGLQGPIGPIGVTGPAGPAGPVGATGATGTFSYASNYSSTTSYTLGQVVFCSTTCTTNGSSYISLVNGPNQGFDPPTSNVNWALIAQAGANGATGATGPAGPTGAMGPAGPTGATGATGATGPAGSGAAMLKDANGVSQGNLIAFDNSFKFTVENSGYLYLVGADGAFPTAQIYWTGASCTGTPYLNDGAGGAGGKMTISKRVIYSAQANSLYSMSNPNAGGISTSVSFTAASIENPTCMTAGYTASGWALTPITPAAVGSTASGAPLKVPAPFQLP